MTPVDIIVWPSLQQQQPTPTPAQECKYRRFIVTTAQAVDWHFWKDDDDSTFEPASVGAPTEILSPGTLANMMGPDYMDRVTSTVLSKDLPAEADNSPTTMPPSGDSSSLSPLMIETAKIPPPSLSLSTMLSYTPDGHAIAMPSTVARTFESEFRNWVGPWSLAQSAACYREAHIMDVCPSNYDRNALTNTCWTECPIDYPVECGMQCLPQNNDCSRENVAKISAVAMSSLSIATFGAFGGLINMGRKTLWAVRCANMLLTATRAIVRFTRNQMILDPQTSQDKLLLLLYQTNWVVADLPATIYICQGNMVPPSIQMARSLMPTAQYILLMVLAFEDSIISGWEHFKAFMKRANFTEAASAITEGEISSLETAMNQNSTCSDGLRSATNLVWMTISELREKNPAISKAEIRLKLSQSDLVLYDIPTVTNNCMSQMIFESTETTAYRTRETLRKTFGAIVNDLIRDGTSDNGKYLATKQSSYLWIDNALTLASVTGLEPTDLSTLFAEYLQPICGPTQFMGEIDDGIDAATLGLNAIKKAFKNSTISWTKKGDGVVLITFKSKDIKDVTVNIMSGGDKVDEVNVKAGSTVQWRSTVKALGGKTLYLDRWRKTFMGLPGRGDGSLVLWVPIARDGGHLEVEAQLNES